jgi:hypothetical protein
VVVVLAILLLARRVNDTPPVARVPLDVIGAILTAVGLGLAVFGVLRSAEWGWVVPKPDGPSLWGVSPTVWLILAGLLTIWVLFEWEAHVEAAGREPLVRASIFAHRQMTGGLVMFFFQYLVQAGLFFTIPLFLSVSLGLTALETGVRILPLSITLLLAAVGVPRLFPKASPRRVVRLGLFAMFLGLVVLFAGLDVDATAKVVTVPLLLAGLGVGALASQLGAVTVSAVPDEQSPDVGGLQNTATNLGAALGTALAGSILIAAQRVPARHRGQPGDPTTGLVPGHRRARQRRAVHVRRGSAGRTSEGRGPAGCHGGGAGGQQGGAGGRPARRHRRPRVDRLVGVVLHRVHADSGAGTVQGVSHGSGRWS